MDRFMKGIPTGLLGVFTALVLIFAGCSSPAEPEKPVLEGDLTVVVDSSAADLETLSKIDVQVFVSGTARIPSSFSGNTYSFKGLPKGDHTIAVFGKGLDGVTYYTAGGPVSIPASGQSQMVLAPSLTLPVKVLNPAPNYAKDDVLFLKSKTSGAAITYTTDGSSPTQNSTAYSASTGIPLTQSMTIKAKAFKAGLSESPEFILPVLVDTGKAPMPKFSLPGGSYNSGFTLTLTGPANSTIYYTENGQDPTKATIAKKTYSSGISINSSKLIRAYAVVAGLTDSAEAKAEYIIGGEGLPTEVPSFSPAPGTYKTSQNITIQAEAGATIAYNLDNAGWVTYSSPIALTVGASAQTYSLQAKATVPGKATSEISIGTYTLDPGAQEKSAAPSLNPNSGNIQVNQGVTITGAAGSTIYLTTDGSVPTTSLTGHPSPYTHTFTAPGNFTVKAIAVESGKLPSDPASATISVLDPQTTPDPVFSKQSGTFTTDITVTLTGEGTIYYATGATVDSLSAYQTYTTGIPVAGNGTVKVIRAYAQAAGKNPSSPITNQYTISYTSDPTVGASPESGTFDNSISVTLAAANPTNGTYRINDGQALNYNNGDQIVLGATAAAGSQVKLTLTNGTTTKDFYYTKNPDTTAYTILFKNATAPEAYVWVRKDAQGNYLDPVGTAGTLVEVFGTWAATEKMTASGVSGWFKADLKAKGIPAGAKVGIIFKNGNTKLSGNDNQYRTTTGWCQMLSGLPSWTDDNPDGPTVEATPGSQEFNTALEVTLTASNPSSGTYILGSGTETPFTSGQKITVNATNVGDTVTLTLKNGVITKQFNYKKVSTPTGVKLYVKKAGSTAPALWFWEKAGAGRAIQQLEGYSWKGPMMTAESTDWWSWDIPIKYNPVATLGLQVNGAAISDLTAPAGGLSGSYFWDGSTWSQVDPRPIDPPTVTVNPDAGLIEVMPFDIAVSASNDPRSPTTAVEYRINSGAWTAVSANKIPSVGTGLTNGQSVTVEVRATNGKGTTTISKTYTKGTPVAPNFSWNNASVYFVITDRFKNGNPANDTSYGRKKVDSSGKTVGTFHGGDFVGLTSKINDNYFSDLGINALWITAPYEQIHGWVGGGSNPGFGHYAYHGYYALDYSNLDANMGTKEEFQALVKAAHTKGIRILVDIVMNHAGYNTLTDMVESNFGGWKGTAPSLSDTYNWTVPSGGNWYSYHDQYIAYRSDETGWGRWWGGSWVRTGDSTKGDLGVIGYPQADGSDLKKALTGLPDFITESTNAVGLPTFLKNKATYGGAFTNWTKDLNKTQRVRDWLVEWLAQWVRDYGIDGFRVDTAKHVEMDSWAALRTKSNQSLNEWRTAEKAKPLANQDPAANWTDNFWMVGEFWNGGASQSGLHVSQGGAFDANINFGMRGATAGALGSASSINGTYDAYDGTNSSDTDGWSFLSYLSSHDTGQQDAKGLFYDNYAGSNPTNQKKAGSLLLMAPGPVQIYYGDEAGRKTGESGGDVDQGTRSDMVFDGAADAGILSHWQKLGQFRAKHMAVGAGIHAQITPSSGYGFTRTWKTTDKVAVVLDASGTVEVNVSTLWADGTLVKNFYDGTTATVTGGKVSFSAGANGVILIEKN